MNKTKITKFNIIFIIIAIIISCFFVFLKQGFHNDEYASYEIANQKMTLNTSETQTYTGEELLAKTLLPSDDNKFNLKDAYETTAKDDHPYLYYFALNIASSIFNKHFSKWIGLSINIFIVGIFFIVLMKAINFTINDEKFSSILTIIFILTSAYVNIFCLTRMYFLLVTEILVLENILLYKPKYYKIFIFITCFLGTITHHHFLIVAGCMVLIDLVFVLISSNDKQKTIKQAIFEGFSSLLGVVLGWITFPYAIQQIFYGRHNIVNLSEKENSFEKVVKFFNMLNQEIFSYTLPVLVMLTIIIFIVNKYFNKKMNANRERVTNQNVKNNLSNIIENKKIEIKNQKNVFKINQIKFYIINILPSIILFVVVVFTAKYVAERYLFIIYPLCFMTIYVMIHAFLCDFLKKDVAQKNINFSNKYDAKTSPVRKKVCKITILLALIISLCTFFVKPYHLFLNEKNTIQKLSEFSDTRTIIIYNQSKVYNIYNEFNKLKNFKSIKVVKDSKFQNIENYIASAKDGMLLACTDNVMAEYFINKILETNQNLKSTMLLYKNPFVTYYLIY